MSPGKWILPLALLLAACGGDDQPEPKKARRQAKSRAQRPSPGGDAEREAQAKKQPARGLTYRAAVEARSRARVLVERIVAFRTRYEKMIERDEAAKLTVDWIDKRVVKSKAMLEVETVLEEIDTLLGDDLHRLAAEKLDKVLKTLGKLFASAKRAPACYAALLAGIEAREARERNRTKRGDRLEAEASQLMKEERFEDAANVFRRARAAHGEYSGGAERDDDPASPEAQERARLAKIRARAEQLQKDAQVARTAALEALEKGGHLYPESFVRAETLHVRGVDDLARKRNEEALAALQEATDLFPRARTDAQETEKRLTALKQEKPPEPADLRTSKPRKAVTLALDWLARHQDGDGKWSCDEFMRHDPAEDRCDGAGRKLLDMGVTGLALLAFLESGFTDRDNHYALEVTRGLNWMRYLQTDDGAYGTRATKHFIYNHAIATLAMLKAYEETKDARYLDSARPAVEFIALARNRNAVWRYVPGGGENDTSVTCWCFRALHAGKQAGLEVDLDRAAECVSAWLDAMTGKRTGKVGYDSAGGPPARPEGQSHLFRYTPSMVAAGLHLRILAGDKTRRPTLIRKGAALCFDGDATMEGAPNWDVKAGTIDMYYWYHGALALPRADPSVFKKWRLRLHKAVVGKQHRRRGKARCGSWDPVGVWGTDGGRVYATAILALTLLHAG
jgi:tetratricopeptide (TPR) repeat protein